MFYPTFHFKTACDIPVEFLSRHGIAHLIMDVDNTLAADGNQTPAAGVEGWLQSLSDAGIKTMILSNNTAKRVGPFAVKMGIPFVFSGAKPLGSGFLRCQKLFGCQKSSMAVVGDQLFTDIWGGHRFGIKTILVDPLGEYEYWPIRIKRFFEKGVLRYYEKKGAARYER